jgi:hypothetical protein
VRQKKMVFAASEKVTLWRLLREPWKQSGFWAKIASFRTLYTLKRFRGDWEMDERSCHTTSGLQRFFLNNP